MYILRMIIQMLFVSLFLLSAQSFAKTKKPKDKSNVKIAVKHVKSKKPQRDTASEHKSKHAKKKAKKHKKAKSKSY